MYVIESLTLIIVWCYNRDVVDQNRLIRDFDAIRECYDFGGTPNECKADPNHQFHPQTPLARRDYLNPPRFGLARTLTSRARWV